MKQEAGRRESPARQGRGRPQAAKSLTAPPGTEVAASATALQGYLLAAQLARRRARRWRFNSELFRHRPHAGPPGRRIAQAQRRAAARVRRGGPRVAQAAAVLRSADLRRPGDRQAGRFARHADRAARRRQRSLVQKVLAGKSPRSGPPNWFAAAKLADVAVRKKLADGGQKPIEASNDPMIALARLVDPPARAVRKTYRGHRSTSRSGRPTPRSPRPASPSTGHDIYPDATFTLRLAFGTVKGYTDETARRFRVDHDRRHLPARRRTTATTRPSRCPRRWLKRKDQAEPRHAVQLRQHGRHHRRQLRQPGRSTAPARSSASSSTATSSRWCSTSSTPTSKPAPSRSTRPASSRPCGRSTTPRC